MSGILLNQGTLHYPFLFTIAVISNTKYPLSQVHPNSGLLARSSDLMAENHGNHISKGCKQTINNIAPLYTYLQGGTMHAHNTLFGVTNCCRSSEVY